MDSFFLINSTRTEKKNCKRTSINNIEQKVQFDLNKSHIRFIGFGFTITINYTPENIFVHVYVCVCALNGSWMCTICSCLANKKILLRSFFSDFVFKSKPHNQLAIIQLAYSVIASHASIVFVIPYMHSTHTHTLGNLESITTHSSMHAKNISINVMSKDNAMTWTVHNFHNMSVCAQRGGGWFSILYAIRVNSVSLNWILFFLFALFLLPFFLV